jgi:hypothetical protein
MKFSDTLIGPKLTAQVFKECRPYLNELRKSNAQHFFYRGTDKIGGKRIMPVKPRKDRQPKDMPFEAHEYIDNYFKKKYGWKPRSEGVFTSYYQGNAGSYGQTTMFFPIGKYEYLFSPITTDLYTRIDNDRDLVYAMTYGMDYDRFDDGRYYDDWMVEYGYENSRGSWWYNGIDTGYDEKEDALESLKEKEPLGLDSKKLVWEPELSYEEYAQLRWEKDYKEILKFFDKKILDSYIQTDLKKSMKTQSLTPEVMWKVDKYYIVDINFEDFMTAHLLFTSDKDFKNTLKRMEENEL